MPIRFLPVMAVTTVLVAASATAVPERARASAALPPQAMMLLQQGAAQCPINAAGLRGSGATVTCFCPASATQDGTVWGTDTYTDDSAVCPAARHAGVIGPRGGSVTFTIQPGLGSFAGSVRNGVSSSNYGPWDGSYSFSEPGVVGVSGVNTNQVAQCPATASQWRGRRSGTRCYCPPSATATQGTVWGSDIYTDDSAICRAALHAGVIARSGGAVLITPLPGRSSYAGSARNGVSTTSYGSWPGSFSVGK